MKNFFSYFSGMPVPSVPTVDVKAVRENQVSGAGNIILDVRTPQEHKNDSIEGSMLLPVDDLARDIERAIPDKDATIYVHCKAGVRSAHATKLMRDKGYKNAFSMKGGLLAWKEAGYPVEEGESSSSSA